MAEGGIATIECQVSDPPANHAVTFLRRTATENERLTWNDIVYSTNDRMSLTKRGDGVYLLTITKVDKEDEGDYICEVVDPFQNNNVNNLVRLSVQNADPSPDVADTTTTTTTKAPIAEKTGKTARVIEKCMAFCSALFDLN